MNQFVAINITPSKFGSERRGPAQGADPIYLLTTSIIHPTSQPPGRPALRPFISNPKKSDVVVSRAALSILILRFLDEPFFRFFCVFVNPPNIVHQSTGIKEDGIPLPRERRLEKDNQRRHNSHPTRLLSSSIHFGTPEP